MQKGQRAEQMRKAFNLVEKPIKSDQTTHHRNYDPILQNPQPDNRHSVLKPEVWEADTAR
jgi:hypothetical protein